MPKAKKTPKTEKMWMAWNQEEGFMPEVYKLKKSFSPLHSLYGKYVPVRIVPEVESQRMRKAANHITDAGKMVGPVPTTEAKA